MLRQLLTHDLYSVLPELNQLQVCIVMDQATKPDDTAKIRGKRGFGSILAKAIPGLITLAVESVSSYIKGRQQQRINTAVTRLRNDDNKISVMILHYNTTLTPSSKAIYSGTKYYDTHIEFHSLFLDVSSTDV